MEATNVFHRNYQSHKRIIVNQGGTGSSKTYSLAQLFIVKALETTGKTFEIIRLNMPSLRETAMGDFFKILREADLYRESRHSKTTNTYNLNGNDIKFFGLDEPQKVRSRRRDYAWLNESNELSLEAFRQINMRTNIQLFMDFNPSDEFHWIYDHVLTREDCELIVSTYLDNPFLPEEVIKEIERFKELDPNYWKVYGLGQRGAKQARIYTHYEMIDSLPDGEHMYGLDFGFNNPVALNEVVFKDDEVYANELLYKSRLTTPEIISEFVRLGVSKDDYIFADSEDPAKIAEIENAGYNIRPAIKGKDSVRAGIDQIKSRKLYITKASSNLLKELQTYSWKVKGDMVLDEPVKVRDHAVDALRYAVHSFLDDMEHGIDMMVF